MPDPSHTVSRRDSLKLGVPAAAGALGMLGAAAAVRGDHHEPEGTMLPEKLATAFEQAYGGDAYALPDLPYPADALEPHIDAQTMTLHHDKHHQGYVDGLNTALGKLKDLAGGEPDKSAIGANQRAISFNGSGHVLHTLFWATMAPPNQGGGGEPSGNLADAINTQFGSFDAFKSYFQAAAGGVKGSGWGILAYEPVGGNLITEAVNEHDVYHLAGTTPLLPVDVWEHAYYLKYQNERG